MPLTVVSFSELQTARQCPLKHDLAYGERWVKDPDTMSPLSKGTAWHQIMEIHYERLKMAQDSVTWDPKLTLTECRNAVLSHIEREIEPRSNDLADLILWMYDGYIEQHGADEDWRILAVEHAAQCRLPALSGRASTFALKVKIDLIVGKRTASGQPQIWVVDHKSCANLPKEKELDLDDQFGLYTWAMRKLGKKVFGQVHNAARTQRNRGDHAAMVEEWRARKAAGEKAGPEPKPQELSERFLRTHMYRTDIELDTIAREAYLTAKNRYGQQRELRRAGVDSPRHTDPQTCRYLCDYTDPCLAGRKGVDLRDYLQARGYTTDQSRH